MKLSELKSLAENAKANKQELFFPYVRISPDVLLKLIERIKDSEFNLLTAQDAMNGLNGVSDTEFIDSYFKKWSDK